MDEQQQDAAPDLNAVIESETPDSQDQAIGAADAPEQVAVEETDEVKNQRIAEEAQEKSRQRAEKRQASLNARFAELTADKKAAEQRAADLMELLKGQKPQATAQPQGEPSRDQFDSYEDFVVARAEYRAEQKALSTFKAQSEQLQAATAQERAAQQAREVARQFAERQAQTAKTIPDYTEVMQDADVQVPDSVAQYLRVMENGPQLAYHMAKNPELAAQFYQLPPHMHAVRLGEMSASLKTAPQVSKAAPPGRTVTSKPSSSNEPPSDPEQYFQWAQKHMR